MPYYKRLTRQRENVTKVLLRWMLNTSDDYVPNIICDAIDKGYKAHIVVEAPVGNDQLGVMVVAPITGKGCYAALEASKEFICD